jgi:hypothetical protein
MPVWPQSDKGRWGGMKVPMGQEFHSVCPTAAASDYPGDPQNPKILTSTRQPPRWTPPTTGADPLMAGRTMVAIAHRLSIILAADVLVVLDSDLIVERSHTELPRPRRSLRPAVSPPVQHQMVCYAQTLGGVTDPVIIPADRLASEQVDNGPPGAGRAMSTSDGSAGNSG